MTPSFWQGRRVLVTGGSGFVGRWLCRALAAVEAEAHILDLAPPARLEVPFEYHSADLRKLDSATALLEQLRPEVIVHLAGQPGVGTSHNDPLGAFEANAVITMHLLEACRRLDDKRLRSIVAVSSNHVYGHQHSLPTPEDVALTADGTYAATKLCGDVLARCYGKTYGLPVGIARMTNSYGGDDHHTGHIITASILAVLSGQRPVIEQSGRDRKGYLYIEDTAAGLMAVAEGIAQQPALRGEAFNLVPNEALTVLELVAAVNRAAGTELEPIVERPDAQAEQEHLDNRKAREQLGWSTRWNIDEGLRDTIAWFRAHTAPAPRK